jgi:SAM-dependent methyltransferase
MEASSSMRQALKRIRRRVRFALEYLWGGGKLREELLLSLLGHHYRSVHRRDWKYRDEPPHFFRHRGGVFQMAFGDPPVGPEAWYRGNYSSEVLRDGDCLLDIGCGDGFFPARFYSHKCRHIDAVDIEPSAIHVARTCHSRPNIAYHLLDAVNRSFPRDRYDVVIWDGAIGHFSADVTHRMLDKIARVLDDDGVFAGSESLGDQEGHDHLQYFGSLADLHGLFRDHFPLVELKSARYRIGRDGFLRTEAFWRCARRPGRLDQCAWQRMPTIDLQVNRAA